VSANVKIFYIAKGETVMQNIKYAIFGATGAVGKALAVQLAERGQPFRVVGRSEERLRRDFKVYEPLVQYCAADLSESAAAAHAAAGVDTIFYTVGVPYPQFEQHPKLTRIAGGVSRLAFRVSRNENRPHVQNPILFSILLTFASWRLCVRFFPFGVLA
jgi:NADPH:quinone reductase-like Zn-dependent oxidoreductase